MTFLFLIALITFLLYLVAVLDLLRGNRTVQALRDVPPLPESDPIRVSIIVAARNEQRNIREALQSLLELDYPDYELIVVDDRSEDETGRILDEMAAASPRLKVIHVDTQLNAQLAATAAVQLRSNPAVVLFNGFSGSQENVAGEIATQRLLPIAASHGLSDETYAELMTGALRILKKLGRA